jgi:hypothetical protein
VGGVVVCCCKVRDLTFLGKCRILLTSGWVPDIHIMRDIKKIKLISIYWVCFRTSSFSAVTHAI